MVSHAPRRASRASIRPRAAWMLAGALGVLAALAPAARTTSAAPLGSPTAVAAEGDEEIVKEFKKYFKKYKDSPTRVEAVLTLEDAQTKSVVKVLLPILKDKDAEVVRACVRVLSRLEDPEAIAALLAALEKQKQTAIRAGLLDAVTLGAYPGSFEPLSACLTDKQWEIRVRAVRALAAAGEQGAAEAILPLTADREPAVRGAALDGLAKLHSRLVVEPAIEELNNESWQVRASAVAALSAVRDQRAIAPLVDRMEVEEGRLVADMGAALAELTGRNFRERVEGWRKFWDTYADRFVMPTDEELAKRRASAAQNQAKYTPPEGSTSYHGVDTPSRSILFVIDVSGSMESEVVDRERFEDGEYPSYSRIDIVKTELQRTIEGLESYVRFNILSFATDMKPWKAKLVPANVVNKSSAVDWAGRLQAIGGSSKQTLAQAGLVGAANLEGGKTNTFGALMWALGIQFDDGVRKEGDYEVEVDTIFFLSDGRPSHGEFVDVQDILREVNAANSLRRIVIHTIALGEFQKDFMRLLAEANGGVFVDLGR